MFTINSIKQECMCDRSKLVSFTHKVWTCLAMIKFVLVQSVAKKVRIQPPHTRKMPCLPNVIIYRNQQRNIRV